MKMIDREKVIKGLECCRRGFCFACPYNDGIDKSTDCKQRWADDALALLKAQEPRVMTLEEAQDALHTETVIWIEMIGYGLDAGIRMKGQDYFTLQNGDVIGINDLDEDQTIAVYGSKFRMWTSRPTDAQREAIPWE